MLERESSAIPTSESPRPQPLDEAVKQEAMELDPKDSQGVMAKGLPDHLDEIIDADPPLPPPQGQFVR
jgi:hypothetical protein